MSDAMHIAIEKASMYVRNYSSSQKDSFSEDELRILRNISAKQLSVQGENFNLAVTDDKNIILKCEVLATIDPETIDFTQDTNNDSAEDKIAALEDKIQLGNNQLGANKSGILSIPMYQYGASINYIAPKSVHYDQGKGIISFKTITINTNNGETKDISGADLYVKENQIFRTGAVSYSPGYPEGIPFKGGKSRGLEPIPPDSHAEKIQKRLYTYLGITSSSINKPANWEYVGFDKLNNMPFFIDTNNISCDKSKGIVYAYGKFGNNYDTYMMDVKNMNFWYFMVEGGQFHLEKKLSYRDICYLDFAIDYYNSH